MRLFNWEVHYRVIPLPIVIMRLNKISWFINFIIMIFHCTQKSKHKEQIYTVKSRFNEWPLSAQFHSLNQDFTQNRDFLMWNSILVTRFHSLNWDFTLNRDSLNRNFTVIRKLMWKKFYFFENDTNLVSSGVIHYSEVLLLAVFRMCAILRW